VTLITRLDPTKTKVEELRAQKERRLREIKQLQNDIKILDSDNDSERPMWEEKTGRLKEAELELDIIKPELALADADKSEQIRIKHLEQEYVLAWYESQLYYAEQDSPANEADIADLKRHIKELKDQIEGLEKV